MRRHLLPIVAAGFTLSCAVHAVRAAPPAARATPAAPPAAAPQATEPAPWPSPAAAGLDPVALGRLVEGARASHADALVVVKDGRVVLDERFGTSDAPIEAMSATKSVVSLAVGLLLDEGRIKSLDQPVSDFYPEWRQGAKRRITIRHLLTHTSGLQNAEHGADEIYPSPDFVQLALAAELTSEPGTAWSYNNKAVNLLAGVVEKASGQKLDAYLRERIFAPLGIVDFGWSHDDAGNPHAMAGLQIRPRDLARIGELMAEGGRWRGKQLVSEGWVEASTMQPSQAFNVNNGLLWWLLGGKVEVEALIDDEGIAALRKAGVDPAFVEKAARLRSEPPRDIREAAKLLEQTFGPDGPRRWEKEVSGRGILSRYRRLGPPIAFMAQGYLGQYLVVAPREKLVLVCMHGDHEGVSNEQLEFADFLQLAVPLLKGPAAAGGR